MYRSIFVQLQNLWGLMLLHQDCFYRLVFVSPMQCMYPSNILYRVHVYLFGLKLHSGWRIRLTADFTGIILTVPSGLA